MGKQLLAHRRYQAWAIVGHIDVALAFLQRTADLDTCLCL
jgi:hypothetical protein